MDLPVATEPPLPIALTAQIHFDSFAAKPPKGPKGRPPLDRPPGGGEVDDTGMLVPGESSTIAVGRTGSGFTPVTAQDRRRRRLRVRDDVPLLGQQ